MHGCLDTVIHLQVELRQLVFLVSRGFLDVSERRGVNDVANDKALDGLILRDGFASRCTSIHIEFRNNIYWIVWGDVIENRLRQ